MKVNEIKSTYERPETEINVQSSLQVAQFIRENCINEEMSLSEYVILICLDRKHGILGYKTLSQGGCSSSIIDTKRVFQTAITTNSQAIILAHNHPSGNLRPSESDKKITSKILEASKILELPLLDHIIFDHNTDNYRSMNDELDIMF